MDPDDDDDSTEDDGDLDAPSQGRSQNQSQVHSRTPQQTAQRTKSPSPKTSPRKLPSPPAVAKTRGRGFRIGGRSRKVTPEPSQEQHDTVMQVEADRESLPPSSQIDTQFGASPRKPRKPFRIGGKNKTDAESAPSPDAIAANINHCRDANLPAPNLSPPSVQQQPAKEEAPREEVREETSEKKAERKRAELKRRNEEIAKKQAQNKKKKRF
ncbi:hypothetical protein N0V94_005336 [Neodidymelliopsis sp. IMI 364377]|nr:hypothetical protein N0V94_005336 [Neodidymelliopsis sp. IMI 364377]